MGKVLVCLLIAALFSIYDQDLFAATTTYYVGQGSSDSDSNSCASAQTDSAGSRKRTIQGGLACVGYAKGVGADHVVQAKGAVYTHSVPIGGNNDQSFPSGKSWSAPFVLRCAPSEICTLRGTGPQNLYITNSHDMFAEVSGFVFDGVNLSGDQVFIGNCCQAPNKVRVTRSEFINNNHENAVYVGNAAPTPGCALNGEPLFVDAASGNFGLAAASPAIGQGPTNIATGVTACGNGAADIGAHQTN